ncbi:hypothetical protein F1880_003593 [Penicillium rolfsii]|nr:hypothetical protein F1880_003593 [Penicillium rolfsii]
MKALKWSTAIDIETSRLDRTKHKSNPSTSTADDIDHAQHQYRHPGQTQGSQWYGMTAAPEGELADSEGQNSSRPAIIPGQAWKSLKASAAKKEEPLLGFPAMHEVVPEMPDPGKGPQNPAQGRAQQPEQGQRQKPHQRGPEAQQQGRAQRPQAQTQHQRRAGKPLPTHWRCKRRWSCFALHGHFVLNNGQWSGLSGGNQGRMLCIRLNGACRTWHRPAGTRPGGDFHTRGNKEDEDGGGEGWAHRPAFCHQC